MAVDTEAGTVEVSTYAPPYDVWVDDEENRFVLAGLELGAL